MVRAERNSPPPAPELQPRANSGVGEQGCPGQPGMGITEYELLAGVGIVMNQHLPVQTRALAAQPQLLPRAPASRTNQRVTVKPARNGL